MNLKITNLSKFYNVNKYILLIVIIIIIIIIKQN